DLHQIGSLVEKVGHGDVVHRIGCSANSISYEGGKRREGLNERKGWDQISLAPSLVENCTCLRETRIKLAQKSLLVRALYPHAAGGRPGARYRFSALLGRVMGGCVSLTDNCIRLRTFLSLDDVELYIIALFQGFIAIQLDCRVVN